MNRLLIGTLAVVAIACGAPQDQVSYTNPVALDYPETKKVDTVHNYFGTEVADPYNWLENDTSEATEAWVVQQETLSRAYLDSIPFRDELRATFADMVNYGRQSLPSYVGDYLFFSHNTGLQPQSVLYYQKGLDGERQVFVDPNEWSEDGSVSLGGIYPDHENQELVLAIQRSGTDWRDFVAMDIATKQPIDTVSYVKFSGASWRGEGYFYSRYPTEQNETGGISAMNINKQVYYHKLGTPQAEDSLVYAYPEDPQLGLGVSVSEDERFVVITRTEGTSGNDAIVYDTQHPEAGWQPVIGDRTDNSFFLGNDGDYLYFHTDRQAPNGRVVRVKAADPAEANWEDVVPETDQPIESAGIVNGRLMVHYLKDVTSQVYFYTMDGQMTDELDLPGAGSLGGLSGETGEPLAFFSYSDFVTPSSIYTYNLDTKEVALYWSPDMNIDPSRFASKQVFYTSKDGTQVPMFIMHLKNLELDGNRPTMLYGYGGFNVSMQPYFSTAWATWVASGGVLAIANLRGGGEYGEAWHEAGMKENKQNVFDDFIAAAEYLQSNGYTNPERTAILGGSNGGLLVGAVMTQRPELFEVALPQVGVLDMLRYHKFTIGHAWAVEYGSSDVEEEFEYLLAYSPLHNLKPGVDYPATLVVTADHDDRVVPAHSFKFAARLQEVYAGSEPQLLRIERQTGHSAGMTIDKFIDTYADMFAFSFYNMEFTPWLSSDREKE